MNLGTGGGAGAAAFASAYGGLSLADATAKAYLAVFGVAADAAKVDAILNASVPNGQGGAFTRAAYLAAAAGAPMESLGAKAAVAGFLLSQAVQSESGVYGAAEDTYTQVLAHGLVPSLDTEFVFTYGRSVQLTGVPLVADPSLT